jgi:hypothetical protein
MGIRRWWMMSGKSLNSLRLGRESEKALDEVFCLHGFPIRRLQMQEWLEEGLFIACQILYRGA